MLDEQLELLRLLGRRIPSADELEAIQRRKLRRLLDYAYQNVPLYRTRFDENHLVPADIESGEDLRRLPAISRDDLRAAGADRLSQKADPASLRSRYSSGSSGKPWKVSLTPTENRLRRALELRSMAASGISFRDRVITLGPTTSAKATLGRLGMYVTGFVSPKLPVEEQVRQLHELKPDVLWIYPTSLRTILHHAGSLRSFIQPRMVVYSAELLDESLRARLEKEGDYEIRNFYGSVECGRVAWECSEQMGLHINTDCSIVHLENDIEVPGAGKSVVITNLNSRVSPYIRYRLGDLCERVGSPCRCGSPLPLLRAPQGRDWDIIRLPSGRLMSPWRINPLLREMPRLLQFRLIQKKPDRLLLQLQFSNTPERRVLDDLQQSLLRLFEEPVTIDLERVDHFKNETLKFRAFVSELG